MTGSDDLVLTLLASKSTVGLARTLTHARFRRWGILHKLDDAFLVMSELITNATAATPYEKIKFRLSRDRAGIVIAVWDSSARVPRDQPLPELTMATLDTSEESWDDNGGWGLHIVVALSVDCGYTFDPAGGKWVWARLKP
jgi:Histidine kinase-like ATPase domain